MQARFTTFIVAIWLCAQAYSYGAQTVQISGHYDVIRYVMDKPKDALAFNVEFTVTLAGESWRICATNMPSATNKNLNTNKWEELVYDGTNTYLLQPSVGYIVHNGHSEVVGLKEGRSKELFGMVNPSWRYSSVNNRFVNIYVPWVVYCLKPNNVTPDMPLPWGDIHSSLAAYGYRWSATASSDGMFLESLQVVRDTSLDLDEKHEFLRPDFAYPQTLEERDDQREILESRKVVPNGFVDAMYTCKEWYYTNGIAIPAVAEFKRYIFGGISADGKPLSYRLMDVTLEVTQVTVGEGGISIPVLSDSAYVRDYRYCQRHENRMYPYASYFSDSGDWKSDHDPELLAKQEEYLKHGPRFGDFGFWANFLDPKRKNTIIVAWLLFALVQVIVVAMVVWKKLTNKKTNKGGDQT